MSSLYLIGPGQNVHGPFAIGLSKDVKELLAGMQGVDSTLKLIRSYELERGWDNLAVTILRRRIGQFGNGDGWFRISLAVALSAVLQAYTATQPPKPTGKKRTPPPEPHFGEVMRAIRTQVFGCTMEVIGVIAGTSTSSVSRWESGELDPGLAEIRRLRAYAYKHGLAWRDAMLFEGAKEEAVL